LYSNLSIVVKDKRAAPKPPPKMPERTRMLAPKPIVHDSGLLPAIRELYSRLPETRVLEPYELQGTLWLLRYTDDLASEAQIAAAVEVARTDFDPEGAAA
jgi:hypothetical protein